MSGGIVVSQSGNVASWFGGAMPTTRSQFRSLLPTTSAVYLVTADTIDNANSDLDTVSFNGPLYFSGNVDLNVEGSILLHNTGATPTSPSKPATFASPASQASTSPRCRNSLMARRR